MENGYIQDSAITASSEVADDRRAANGRLNLQDGEGKIGAWIPRKQDDFQWLQVNFCNWTTVGGVGIQGRYNAPEWVSSFSLSFGDDGVFFEDYQEDGSTKVLNVLYCMVLNF